jgi:Xaa-Pro aminopeptidase/Xaa-Pro dipeptidase
VAACVAGATVGDVNEAAAVVTGASAFRESASAMIGHGIGLETVELPYLQPGGADRLEPGMVLCVEPGIFVPGWAGVSIEQEIVVTASGPPDVLTPTPVRLW